MAKLIIEDPHKPVELQFVMRGPVFDAGLPIPLVTKSLDSVQGILDRSYLVLANTATAARATLRHLTCIALFNSTARTP